MSAWVSVCLPGLPRLALAAPLTGFVCFDQAAPLTGKKRSRLAPAGHLGGQQAFKYHAGNISILNRGKLKTELGRFLFQFEYYHPLSIEIIVKA